MMSQNRLPISPLGAAALFFLLAAHPMKAADQDEMAANFASPPSTSAPQTWWHWMNGNVSKTGITADLESMKRVGLGGATIVNVSYAPPGPAPFMSDAWQQMVQHAVHESARLGLQLGMENCAGWSSSGGPWITPEYAMQMITTSEIRVQGGTPFTGTVPQPTTQLGYYRDIALLAFPTPPSARSLLKDASPTVTGSDPMFDGAKLLQGQKTFLPPGNRAKPQYVQFEFAQPFAVRTVAIYVGSKGAGEIEASDDGQTFRKLRSFTIDLHGARPPLVGLNTFEIAPTSARFFRVVFSRTESHQSRFTITQIDLSNRLAVDDFRSKGDFNRVEHSDTVSSEVPVPGESIDPAQVLNLTGKMDAATGALSWTPPAGDWTVLRVGYTPTAETNHPAPKTGEGLECDKLSRAALKFHWDHLMAKIVAESGPLAGKTLNQTLIDSYEVGSQNWTAGMEKEFLRRQGYDLTPYLPALAGWVVGSPEQSNRVLWDFRRTVADLFTENYFDYMGELARGAGLQLQTEPYGDGPFDSMTGGRGADMPMSEFWAPGSDSIPLMKGVASISHTYGRKLVAAESFTGNPEGTRWQMDPAILKPIGDLAFVSGVNHMIFHRFAHQPWLDRVPGMTAGPWGTMLERTNTWWEPGTAWIHYLTRCQYLLEQGRFVADALVLVPEGSPSGFSEVKVPAGHDWDCGNADVVMHRLTVKDGKLVLPDGMTYRVLMLPSGNAMTPELLRRIGELAQAGATIIGPQPLKSPSFRDYPQCDARVQSLADSLWKSGKISNVNLDQAFSRLNLPPDFECQDPKASFLYLHRVAGDRDLYFISNQHGSYRESDCFFRVTGKVPELWHPDTGRIEPVATYDEEQGRTRIHLRLEPTGSVFVVFQTQAATDHPVALDLPAESSPVASADDLKVTHAIYESIEEPANAADVTDKLNSLILNGTLSATPNFTLFGDPAPMQQKQLRVEFTDHGQPGRVTVPEGSLLDLPVKTKQAAFAPAQLEQDHAGPLTLQAWRGGTYTVRFSSGKLNPLTVSDLAAPVTLAGPWQLAFQPDRGAPPSVTFDTLASWSDSAISGIKYFSGTATYTKSFDVAPTLLGADHRLYLDLGDVEVIAQVKLNGKDLGILWKPPYGVDVTNAVQPGRNDLEIKVTNLWVNRLIGDEQLPPDSTWSSDGSLKAWPQWLLDGKPSPTGRITFTTWHHWNKDEPLKPSGLLGPVTLIPSVVLPVR